MKRMIIFFVVLIIATTYFAGAVESLNDYLTEPATVLIENILGTNWASSTETQSSFSIETSKEMAYNCALQAGIIMGWVPIVSDFEGGVLVLSSTPGQVLNGTIIISFTFESVSISQTPLLLMSINTNKVFYSKYFGWDYNSGGSTYHKLTAVIFSYFITVKRASYTTYESFISDPEKTLEKLKEYVDNE